MPRFTVFSKWVSFALITTACLLYFPLYSQFSGPYEVRTVTFRFDPADPVYQGKLSLSGTEIKAVELLGSFNNWNLPERGKQRFWLKKTNGVYQTQLDLACGQHAYKFRVTTGSGIYWTEDITAEKFRPDGFGGRNSVLELPCPGLYRWPLFMLLFTAFLWLFFETLLKPLLRRFLSFRMPYRWKVMTIFLSVALLANGLWLVIQLSHLSHLWIHIDREKMQILTMFLTEGLPVEDQFDHPENREELTRRMARFMGNVFSLKERGNLKTSSGRVDINYLIAYDRNGNRIAGYHSKNRKRYLDSRPDLKQRIESQFNRLEGVNPYEMSYGYWDPEAAGNNSGVIRFTRSFSLIGMLTHMKPYRRWDLLPIVVYPVRFNNEVTGYLAYDRNTSSLKDYILEQFVKFNLYALLPFIVLIIMLSHFMARQAIKPLDLLKGGMDRIREEDYKTRLSIPTGDEFEELSQTFNQMTEHLRAKQEFQPYVSQATWKTVHQRARDEDREPTATEIETALLFTDIVGFTILSNRFSENILIPLLSHRLGELSEIICSHGGDIDKFIGDAIFAYFLGSDRVDRALRAATSMHKFCSQEFQLDNDTVRIQLRTGLHAGRIFIADIGTGQRRDLTPMGRDVNLTQRIQSAAAPGEILVSSALKNATSSEFDFETTGEQTLKGFEKKFELFRLKM